MQWFWAILGVVLAAVWLDRLRDAAFGLRDVPQITGPEWDRSPDARPRVSLIVAARNEQDHIEAAVGSLLVLDYPDYEVLAVNDRSTDRTGEMLDRVAQENPARLRVLHVSELPPGWLGKPHAMGLAAQQASGDWLLFTDADVSFRPDALRRALLCAEEVHADHLILFPTALMHSLGERMVFAFFPTLAVFGHRPWKVSDPRTQDYLGMGAFNMIRRQVYEDLGVRQALRMDVLDDMKLGKLVKEGGYAQRVASGYGLISLRWGHGALGVLDNLTKNLFALMLYRWPRTVGAAFLVLLLNLGPFVGLIFAPGWARLGYALAVGAVALIYLCMSRYSRISPLYFVLHPVSTTLFAGTLLRSMFLTLGRGGVVWRGTKYPLDELRKGLV
jgi:cellulose synthase/poly-beta-1,6-N-acetylglucosamine synthase-like glycosyltransferase